MDRELHAEVVHALRTMAEGAGATVDAATAFDATVGLAKVEEVSVRLHLTRPRATLALLTQAATDLSGHRGRLHLPDAEIAACALALGRFEGIEGLLDRLAVFAEERGLQPGTVRGYWRHVAIAVADGVLNMPAGDVQVTLADDVDAERWDYRCVETHVVYLMEARRPKRVLVVRELQALRAPLTNFTFPFGYPKDIKADVVAVLPLTNCQVASSILGGLGEQVTTLALPRTARGQSVRFSYEITISTDQDDLPFIRHRGRVPGGRFRFEIQFKDSVPSQIWSFYEQKLEYDPTLRPDNSRRVKLSRLGYAEVNFPRETPGLSLGLAWIW